MLFIDVKISFTYSSRSVLLALCWTIPAHVLLVLLEKNLESSVYRMINILEKGTKKNATQNHEESYQGVVTQKELCEIYFRYIFLRFTEYQAK